MSTQLITPPNETQVPQRETKSIECGTFPGAFGKFQRSAWISLKLAGFTQEIAHKVAMDFGSNIGDAMRNGDDESFKNKVNKAKDNGDSVIKISASGTTTTSRAMSLVRLCQVTDGLFKEGLQNTRKITMEKLPAGEKLPDGSESVDLEGYIADCAKWASEQVWAE